MIQMPLTDSDDSVCMYWMFYQYTEGWSFGVSTV